MAIVFNFPLWYSQKSHFIFRRKAISDFTWYYSYHCIKTQKNRSTNRIKSRKTYSHHITFLKVLSCLGQLLKGTLTYSECFRYLTHFIPLVSLYTPSKHWTNLYFLNVFKGYRIRLVSWNGLRQNWPPEAFYKTDVSKIFLNFTGNNNIYFEEHLRMTSSTKEIMS